MSVNSLNDVLTSLRKQVGNDLALGPICTRVMLRTGVNLRAQRPEQATDSVAVGKVVSILSDMGYAF
jgi:hypothetical protein